MNTETKFYHDKKILIPLIISALVIIYAVFSFIWSLIYKTADNAFVMVEPAVIKAKVAGEITELNINDESSVKKGEIIAEIDKKEYEEALEKATKNLEKAQEELNISKSEIDKINSALEKSKNKIEKAKSGLESANSDYVRYKNAYKDGTVTKKDLDNAIKNLEVAKTRFIEAQNKIEADKKNLGTKISKKESQNLEIKNLISKVEQSKLDLSYTTITAPVDGTIADKKIEIGSFVAQDSPVVSIIPYDYRIIAEFKKDKAKNLKKGQKALINIEQPKKTHKGKIENIFSENGDKVSVEIVFNNDMTDYKLPLNSKVKVKIKVK